MIYKNVSFLSSKDATVVEFGTGDVCIGAGFDSEFKKTCLFFYGIKQSEIGDIIDDGIKFSESDINVLFMFNNIKSLDVLIEQAQRAKEMYINDKTNEN